MAEGGFLIKFDGKKAKPRRGYAVAVDYDEWTYAINNEKKKSLPKGAKKIYHRDRVAFRPPLDIIST